MKRSIFNYSFIICILLLSRGVTSAQVIPLATAEGHVYAEIIPIYSASETAELNFGRFSPGPQGGFLVLTPQSTISVLGTVFKGSGPHNAASFYVSGDLDAAYTVSLAYRACTSETCFNNKNNANRWLVFNTFSRNWSWHASKWFSGCLCRSYSESRYLIRQSSWNLYRYLYNYI